MKGTLRRLVREKGFWWYGFCQYLSMWAFLVFFRVRVHGRENLPADRGALLASNHQSFFDPVLVGLALSKQIHPMARDSLFRIPVFSALIRSLNAFPVRRGSGDREALKRSWEILKGGHYLVVFPEGTRTRDGGLNPPKGGVGLMVRKTGAVVVPTVIHGAYRAWPEHRMIFELFRPIRVAFGPPIPPEEAGRGLEERLSSSWRAMMARFEALPR